MDVHQTSLQQAARTMQLMRLAIPNCSNLLQAEVIRCHMDVHQTSLQQATAC
jgi:hypothetical protein